MQEITEMLSSLTERKQHLNELAKQQFSQRDGHPRSALGVIPLRMKKYEKKSEEE
jgi:hypothetical protein